MFETKIEFPIFTGLRCLMMPYIQGNPNSVPSEYAAYKDIILSLFFKQGDIGYLTIDESMARTGQPHRGSRKTTNRALHTEAGRRPGEIYAWGGGGWGDSHNVTLDRHTEIFLANSLDNSCAVWNAVHERTSLDGDLGHALEQYQYKDALLMKAGEVYRIGILTPHESLPVKQDTKRQFLRIVSAGVYGREPYFTRNPLMPE